jgi:hypothetical protein
MGWCARDSGLATSMKMSVFWVVALCSLVKVDQRFMSGYCLHQGDHLQVLSPSSVLALPEGLADMLS